VEVTKEWSIFCCDDSLIDAAVHHAYLGGRRARERFEVSGSI